MGSRIPGSYEKRVIVQLMSSLLASIYQYNGQIYVDDFDGREVFQLPINDKQLGDMMGLIDIVGDNKINFTEKGKYFAPKYGLEKLL